MLEKVTVACLHAAFGHRYLAGLVPFHQATVTPGLMVSGTVVKGSE